jgi:hypothetical protein
MSTTQHWEVKDKSFETVLPHFEPDLSYRKWCLNSGEFCGSFYQQDVKTKAIRMGMKTFAENMRPANIKKGVHAEQSFTFSDQAVERNKWLFKLVSISRPS